MSLKSLIGDLIARRLRSKPKLVPVPKLKKLKPRGYSVQCGLCDHRIRVTRKEAVLGIQGTCGCHGTLNRGPKVRRDRQHKKQLKLIRRKMKEMRR